MRILLKIADAQIKAGDREAALRTLEQALVAERSMNREELEDGPFLGRDFVEMQIAVVGPRPGTSPERSGSPTRSSTSRSRVLPWPGSPRPRPHRETSRAPSRRPG